MTIQSFLRALIMLLALPFLAIGQIHSQGLGHPIAAPPPPGAKSAKCTKRPIPQLQDVTAKSGITFTHTSSKDKKFIFESMTGGVVIFDYDRDGWPDIYFTNAPTIDMAQAGQTSLGVLYHNNHDGTFTDVTQNSGLTKPCLAMGGAVGDYDNDGWPDLYITCLGGNILYHNNGDGTFSDVTSKAGVADGRWSAGASFGDYDGDGFVDLMVANYVDFHLNDLPQFGSSAYCMYRGVAVQCGPRGLKGAGDSLFHNNGDGTFTDVSKQAGVSDPNAYYGFTAIFVDVNNDGKPDLLVANDSEPNFLYINNGDGTFQDQSYISGFALNNEGREIASMGLAVGDYRNNGLVDLLVTDFSDDFKALYRNDGEASFTEVANEAGLAQIPVPFVGWGDGFLDYDNDGWKDVMMINGHVYPQVDEHDWRTTFAERPLLFHNNRNGKFEYVPPVRGSGLATLTSGRGAAFGDLFNDGKIDVVINPIDGPPVLLRNVNPDHHHWVEMKLVGGPKSPRDATCATAYLTANGMRQRQDVLASGSYISGDGRRPHFGF